MLEVVGLEKSYGAVRALDGFDLTVETGEIVGLVGHNGAGKTTMVDCVLGLTRPDAGRVRVAGREPRRARGHVGVAPQHIALYPSLSPREHLTFFGGVTGVRGESLRAAMEELSYALRLEECFDRPAGVLSGGQQRRTQAAIALIHRPSLLVLDEPTAGADLESRQALLDVVKQRAGEGAAVVYVTHYLPELSDLGATIAVACRGRVVARGTSSQLLEGLPGEVRVTLDDEELRMSSPDPAAALIEMLGRIDRPVRSVDVHHASLDDLYRSLAVTDAP